MNNNKYSSYLTGSGHDEKLAVLVEDYLASCRAGESPDLDSLADKNPEFADDILKLFPAIAAIEEINQEKSKSSLFSAINLDNEAFIPPKLGEYTLAKELGRGGMGVVYEAVQESLNRKVAIKILPSRLLSSPTAKERFLREAQLAAGLQHPNIVPIYSFGEQEGNLYYSMHFVRGLGLDQFLNYLRYNTFSEDIIGSGSPQKLFSTIISECLTKREKQKVASDTTSQEVMTTKVISNPDMFDSSEENIPDSNSIDSIPVLSASYYKAISETIAQAADGLGCAHKQGILHRDIKPANLLLDEYGHIWVADFGLARALENERLTRSWDILGTLPYMAPEQFDGKCSEQSDIYSLGLTLYEMVTFTPVFRGMGYSQIIKNKVTGEIGSPLKINSEIPVQLGEVILKAIAPLPEDRFSNAEKMADALRNVDYSVTSISTVGTAKSKGIFIAAVCFAALIIAALILWALNSDEEKVQPGDTSEPAIQQTVIEVPELSGAPSEKIKTEPESKGKTYKGFTFTVESPLITEEKESPAEKEVKEDLKKEAAEKQDIKKEEVKTEEKPKYPAAEREDRQPPPFHEPPPHRGEHPPPPPGRGHPPPHE
ncbi:MAG: serine/threonine protein kinase, partial [Planctomycetota bacterium]